MSIVVKIHVLSRNTWPEFRSHRFPEFPWIYWSLFSQIRRDDSDAIEIDLKLEHVHIKFWLRLSIQITMGALVIDPVKDHLLIPLKYICSSLCLKHRNGHLTVYDTYKLAFRGCERRSINHTTCFGFWDPRIVRKWFGWKLVHKITFGQKDCGRFNTWPRNLGVLEGFWNFSIFNPSRPLFLCIQCFSHWSVVVVTRNRCYIC